jgi:large subunit ribosomal protein L5
MIKKRKLDLTETQEKRFSMARLSQEYKDIIKKKMMDKFKYSNIHQIPKLSKIVLNMGVGDAKEDTKILDKAQEELSLIAGQKAIKTKAKKAIAAFKIREGMALGVSVTLRNKMMYEFLDRLVNIAIPRIRYFRGLNPKSFDGNGNYTLGIKEQIIFPEINYDKIDKVRGLDITICTSAANDEEALELLKNFNMPFPAAENN